LHYFFLFCEMFDKNAAIIPRSRLFQQLVQRLFSISTMRKFWVPFEKEA